MRRWMVFMVFALISITGCSPSYTGTQVWIDVPLDGLALSSPQTINIEGHASSPEGVAEIQISVNGDIIATLDTSSSTEALVSFSSSFTPTEYGEYLIEVTALGSDGQNSSPDSARVVISDAVVFTDTPVDFTPTPVCGPTPVPGSDGPTPVPGCGEPPPEDECGPTPVPGSDGPTPIPGCESEVVITPFTLTPIVAEVEYWAEPSEIDAGDCFTIYWEVMNVQRVVFGGIERDFTGSYHDCICETLTYPLTVTHLDDSTEQFFATILVNGTCHTPTPPPDTTAPAAPQQLKPTNGQDMGCLAYVILRWQAPSDPSGISSYRVQIERHSGDNNWQAVSGSPFTGLTDTNFQYSVECGYTYRWRVRAIDGAGNVGDWSGWFTFNVPLI